MAIYSYTLASRDNVSDNRAKNIIDACMDAGLLRGDVLHACWNDLEDAGSIKMSLRYISCLIEFKELSRDEWLRWLGIITDVQCGDEKTAQALYLMLIGLDEIDSDEPSESNYDLFSDDES